MRGSLPWRTAGKQWLPHGGHLRVVNNVKPGRVNPGPMGSLLSGVSTRRVSKWLRRLIVTSGCRSRPVRPILRRRLALPWVSAV
ncbi:hypothetical protein EYC55_18275 [Xanthomonas oryzae]|nr:hypothetical protein EYC54_18290 [Xanthomonas oryzae]QBG96966.1 hypothetical protein EYC55_18275 [Xanthomonas oryzae]QBH04810.1 hypothetical protein EYC57_17465 [Xanthomonas oryzae]